MLLTIIPDIDKELIELAVVTVTYVTDKGAKATLQIHGAIEVCAYAPIHSDVCDPEVASVQAKVVGEDWNLIRPRN